MVNHQKSLLIWFPSLIRMNNLILVVTVMMTSKAANVRNQKNSLIQKMRVSTNRLLLQGNVEKN